MKSKTCLVCGIEVKDAFWLYIWKAEQGYCCDTCADIIGNHSNSAIELSIRLLERVGAYPLDWKEKFGEYRMDIEVSTEKQNSIAQIIVNYIEKRFSELSFRFYLVPTYKTNNKEI